MTTIRIATFNCENLFARYHFKDNEDPTSAVQDGWLPDQTKFELNDDDAKRITGNAIEATNADVIALQEVESLGTLKRFRSKHIDGGSRTYPYLALIDGNDPRLIDVAVMSKYPISRIRTHQHVRKSPTSRSYIFSRDCLEVDIEVDGRILTLFVQHYKSMIGGRSQTKQRRLDQVVKTREIVENRFGTSAAGDHPWIVLGDFNDYLGAGTALDQIVGWDQAENVIARLPEEERWTHYWNSGNEYRQLDYLLVSSTLSDSIKALPEIIRKGLPKRATRYTGPRFRGVGENSPKASDHCPVTIELEF